jgi:hypothetical protein
MSLISATIPNSWTPFQIDNNKFAFSLQSDPNTVHVCSIDPTTYWLNAEDLAKHTADQMNLAISAPTSGEGQVFTGSFNENTFRLIWSSTQAFQFELPESISYDNGYSMLGMSDYVGGYETMVTSPDVCTLQRTQSVYIATNTVPLSTSWASFPNGQQILGACGVNVNSGGVIHYQDTSDNNSTPLDQHSYINTVSFTLLDDEGRILDLKGRNVSFELSFTY